MNNPFLTTRGELRMKQGNASLDDIELIMTYGHKEFYRSALIYTLRKSDVNLDEKMNRRMDKLAGTAVIATPDGRVVITNWRNMKRWRGRSRQTGGYIKEKGDPFVDLG